ncbi:MAG: DegT/DnrJ/EryC1/StrS family aminotransferase [Proteobacteria bacterium]|nr:DegT/DnrJ/EryC1/StrS family aminotransferase [Pseudomonadota bacterium]
MQVPLLDLRPQHEGLRDEIIAAVTDVIDSTRYIMGPELERFEEAVAEYSGCKYALGVSSGTDALLLALMSLNIGPGDKVLVPDFSFFATAGVVSRLNAEPVFLEIDPTTFNLCPKHLEEKLESYTEEELAQVKAVIPVHLFGQCADMQAILGVAQQFGIAVVEDAAQAIGAEYRLNGEARRAGAMSDVGCMSFFPSKNLGGVGDGGMVTTNDTELHHQLHIKRVHGAEPKYYHKVIGGNFRMDPIQACVLRIKLQRLEAWHEQRRQNAAQYDQLLGEAQLEEVVCPAAVYQDDNLLNHHIYNQYTVRVQRREDLRKFLQERGVATEIYYPVPFHRQECFADLVYQPGSLPESDRAAREVLALPIYPGLTTEMQEYVVENLVEFYRS